jgi:histidinol-phosphatase (PHP family)
VITKKMDIHGLVDYHLHTAVTIDAHASEIEHCQRAVSLGLREIAFTNHIILGNPDYCMSPDNMNVHWQKIQICQQRFPELIIRMGVEVDYFDGRENDILSTIHAYEQLAGRPFDFILGSVHYLKGIFFSSRSHAQELFKSPETSSIGVDRKYCISLYNEYFICAARAVKSGIFDVMAHPDLIKKHTGEFSPPVAFDDYQESVEGFIRALVDHDVGIEVNTRGLAMKVKELFPSEQFLSHYISETRLRGVEPVITLGSDAHLADNLGAFLVDGVQAIQRADCLNLTGFNRRKRYSIQLGQVNN